MIPDDELLSKTIMILMVKQKVHIYCTSQPEGA